MLIILIIPTLLLINSTVRSVYASTFVVFPIAALVIAMFIGFMLADGKLGKLYKKIQPEQKYAGYDSSKGKSIYKDDIDKFTSTSEILIGKNVDNLKCLPCSYECFVQNMHIWFSPVC